MSFNWPAHSRAEQPLVLHEIRVNEAVSAAAAKVAAADLDLAQWRLEQLDDLRSRGFASWLEAAQQQVLVETMRAQFAAADQYRIYLRHVADRVAEEVATSNAALSDRESVRLVLPGSPRVVGWLESQHLTPQTVRWQRGVLKQALAERDAIDPSALAKEVEKAALRMQGLRARQRNDDGARLRHAELELRLAEAELELARASLAEREVLARRLELLPALDDKQGESRSASFARPGTPLVDITCDRGLSSITRAAVLAETSQNESIDLLESQKRQLADRISRLEELTRHPLAGQSEPAHAKAQLEAVTRALDQRRGRKQQQLHLLQAIADADQTTSQVVVSTNSQTELSSEFLCHATALRHVMEIQRARFQVEATRRSLVAQRAQLREFERRLQRVAELGGDRPGEFQHARDRVLLCEQQIRAIDQQDELLDMEEQRFVNQFAVQHTANYALIQGERGQLVQRNDLRDQASPWLAIGFVSSRAPVIHPSEYPLGYIESPAAYQSCTCAADDYLRHTLTLAVTTWRSHGWIRTRKNLEYGHPAKVFSPPANGLALATDSITYSKDLCRYVPFGLWQLDPGRANIVFRSRLRSYSDEYAFGIRRTNGCWNRPRANAYGGPWYFPGSPTNFR